MTLQYQRGMNTGTHCKCSATSATFKVQSSHKCCSPVTTEHQAMAAMFAFDCLSSISTFVQYNASGFLAHLLVIHNLLIMLAVGKVADHIRVTVGFEFMVPLCLPALLYSDHLCQATCHRCIQNTANGHQAYANKILTSFIIPHLAVSGLA